MHYPKWLSLLAMGAAAGGMLLFGGMTASAETALPEALQTAETASAVVATATGPEFQPQTETPEITGGWVIEDGCRKYQYSDGSFAVHATAVDGVLYLFDSSGTQLTGWQKIDETWHYYDSVTYEAAVGAQQIDGTAYLFDYSGAQKTGWRTVDGVRRYYDPETGKPDSGWVSYGDYRYYVSADSGKATGEFTVDGVRYQSDSETGTQKLGFCKFSDNTVSYYDQNGAPVSGWVEDHGSRYYFNDSYTMQTGMQNISGKNYYLGNDGIAQTGMQTVDGKKYYFATDGSMQTGFQNVGGKKYYFGTDGVMKTGWQTFGSQKYYFNADGTMVTGEKVIDGKKYRFNADGTQKKIKICLDAGHYGKYNRSPVNGAYFESDMSWRLHLKLKSALEARGMEVITTRPTQAGDLGLETRGKTSAGCDLFLSLHSNACGNSSVDAPLACCTVTGTMDVLGQQLANTVHQVMSTAQGGTIWKRVGNNGDYYGVLRGATSVGTPAILLEHSYHTNLRATNWLLSDTNLQRLADAEAAVIAAYFGL